MDESEISFDYSVFLELSHLYPDIFREEAAFLGSDGGPGPSDSRRLSTSAVTVPAAESSDIPNQPADSFPSVDGSSGSNLLVDEPFLSSDPSELLPSTEIAYRLQSYQDGSSRNLDFDPTSLAAPYHDFEMSESLKPVEYADTTQSIRPSTSLQDEWLRYLDVTPDPVTAPNSDIEMSEFLMPAQTTNTIQATPATGLMEYGTPRIIDLDPPSHVTPFEVIPTSSEELSQPPSADTAASAEVAMTPSGVGISHSLKSSAPSHDFVTTTLPHRSQPKSGRSFSSNRLVPLRPKALAVTQNNDLSLTRSSQGPSSSCDSSSNMPSATHSTSSVARGKRKRSLSPQVPRSDVPEVFLCVFRANVNSGAAEEEAQQLPVSKRAKSAKPAKTCLRCQLHQKKVRWRPSSGLGSYECSAPAILPVQDAWTYFDANSKDILKQWYNSNTALTLIFCSSTFS